MALKIKNNKSQEEIVGFALIVVVVAVIILVFISFFLKNSQEDSEPSSRVENFIQAFLQYTTECEDNYPADYYSVSELIEACNEEKACLNEEFSCEVLETLSEEMVRESWKIEEDSPVKGYILNISYLNKEPFVAEAGEITSNSKGASQAIPGKIVVSFKAYY